MGWVELIPQKVPALVHGAVVERRRPVCTKTSI